MRVPPTSFMPIFAVGGPGECTSGDAEAARWRLRDKGLEEAGETLADAGGVVDDDGAVSA